MKAMLLERIGIVEEQSNCLSLADLPEPVPGPDEVLIRVHSCGVCHTELDEIEGRTPPPHLPIILGHQVIGHVEAAGMSVHTVQPGARVGVAWIFSSCGSCVYCQSDRENLCPQFLATGRDRSGGYAEQMVARADYVYPIPEVLSDVQAAPLLCAGAIGYRSLRLASLSDGQRLGLMGFGASAHLVLKMARHRLPNSRICVFARSPREREFALQLGAHWAGEIQQRSPELLDAIIDTTPAWSPIIESLENLVAGGRLVINAIRKESADHSALSRVDYERHLWMEKEIKSVANVTRRDVSEFIAMAAGIRIEPHTTTYALADANRALFELKSKGVPGAKVLVVE
jgi:alcohol dehydrogenase, propanol-preferring